MNKFRTIALALATIATLATSTSAQIASTSGGAAAAGRRAGSQGKGAGKRLLKGVNLSAAERTSLTNIRGKYSANEKSLRSSMQPAIQEARTDRARGDTAAARAALARTKDTRKQLKTIRTQEHNEIRGALTPANRQAFDANVRQAKAQRRSGKATRGKKLRGTSNVLNGSRV